MNNDELLQLYDMTIKESQYWLNSYEKKITFFWKIISSILGGLIIGIFKATTIYHFLILIIAPILLWFITEIAKKALYRDYLSFLECVTVRAKIESELALNKSKDYQNLKWKNEPIIPSRYIKSRNKFNTSKDFINNKIKFGYQEVYTKLFNMIKAISYILIITLIILSLVNFRGYCF